MTVTLQPTFSRLTPYTVIWHEWYEWKWYLSKNITKTMTTGLITGQTRWLTVVFLFFTNLSSLVVFPLHQSSTRLPERSPHCSVLHAVEGLALLLLCSCQISTRKLAVGVLREIRCLFTALGHAEVQYRELISSPNKHSGEQINSFTHLCIVFKWQNRWIYSAKTNVTNVY